MQEASAHSSRAGQEKQEGRVVCAPATLELGSQPPPPPPPPHLRLQVWPLVDTPVHSPLTVSRWPEAWVHPEPGRLEGLQRGD